VLTTVAICSMLTALPLFGRFALRTSKRQYRVALLASATLFPLAALPGVVPLVPAEAELLVLMVVVGADRRQLPFSRHPHGGHHRGRAEATRSCANGTAGTASAPYNRTCAPHAPGSSPRIPKTPGRTVAARADQVIRRVPDSVVCFTNRKRAAGTRRLHQPGHMRSIHLTGRAESVSADQPDSRESEAASDRAMN
jgi:hypothetical protein